MAFTEPDYWNEAKKYLTKADPMMAKLITQYPEPPLRSHGKPLVTLCKAIIGQQISVAAADAVYARFKGLYSNRITANKILESSEEELRSVGLSRQKVLYLKNIAKHFKSNKITPKYFKTKNTDEIYKELLAIKGIGKWTAEMFGIFYLLDSNLLPLGDIGLIRAVQNHYNNEQKLTKEAVATIAQKWTPYRTVATWYLWRSIDPDPVQY